MTLISIRYSMTRYLDFHNLTSRFNVLLFVIRNFVLLSFYPYFKSNLVWDISYYL